LPASSGFFLTILPEFIKGIHYFENYPNSRIIREICLIISVFGCYQGKSSDNKWLAADKKIHSNRR
jgi:hypothetical protein